MTGTSPGIFRQTGNTLLLSGQWEKRKTGPQEELHHRQVEFEILCNDPAGRFGALLVFFLFCFGLFFLTKKRRSIIHAKVLKK